MQFTKYCSQKIQCYTKCMTLTTGNNFYIQYILTWSQVLGYALAFITISELPLSEALKKAVL